MTEHTQTTQEQAPKPALDKQLLQEKVLGSFTQYDINTLKSTIANGLNSAEFGLFLNTCVATGLNPFLKQVIPILYDSEKNGRRFDIQVPVEGIEHLARLKEGWLGYELQLVCENDVFKAKRDNERNEWIITSHEIEFPRGRTMGAYCIVPRQGFKDVVVFMEVPEVEHLTKEFPASRMWNKWFNDMFKKHVKKRALREQFGIEIDDMSDLNAGAQEYNSDLPAYKTQQRKDISQEEQQEQEPIFDEAAALADIWDQIAEVMDKYKITKEGATAISKRRFNGKEPQELNGPELAALLKFMELESAATKAKERTANLVKETREKGAQEAAFEEVEGKVEQVQPEEPKQQESTVKDEFEEIDSVMFFEQGELL